MSHHRKNTELRIWDISATAAAAIAAEARRIAPTCTVELGPRARQGPGAQPWTEAELELLRRMPDWERHPNVDRWFATLDEARGESA